MLEELLDIFDIRVLIARTPCDTARFFDNIKDPDSNRFSVLAFTSGTTGNIKGVMLSQHNVVSNLRAAIQNNHLKTPTLQVLPMNHTYGFNPDVLTPIYNGNTVCINMSLKELAKKTLLTPAVLRRPFQAFFYFFVNLFYRKQIKKGIVPNII